MFLLKKRKKSKSEEGEGESTVEAATNLRLKQLEDLVRNVFFLSFFFLLEFLLITTLTSPQAVAPPPAKRTRRTQAQIREDQDKDRQIGELQKLVEFNVCGINLVDLQANKMTIHDVNPEEGLARSFRESVPPAVLKAMELSGPFTALRASFRETTAQHF